MNETQQIELYLQNQLAPEEKLMLDARCILDESFRNKIAWQQKTYDFIQEFGKKKLRMEIREVEERMFSQNKFMQFRNKIRNIFNQ